MRNRALLAGFSPLLCTNAENRPTRRLLADDEVLKAHGIQLISFEMCHDAMFVVVAVADTPTLDFMKARYSPVTVAGWLRPVN